MSRGEFSLIEKYFDRSPQRSDVDLAVGDDCAILTPPERDQLALSVDTLVAGVHFFADVCPRKLGHKALAVNQSPSKSLEKSLGERHCFALAHRSATLFTSAALLELRALAFWGAKVMST